MYDQLAAMEFAATRLVQNKGKHSMQFKRMPEELKNQFLTLSHLVDNVKNNYEKFLFDIAKENKELAERFMPPHLHERIPVVLAAKNCTLI